MEVVIGCKLPHGLILELINKPPKDPKEQVLQPAPTGRRVTLKGANSMRIDLRAAQGVHPYATTRIDKAFWDAWLAENKNLTFVTNGLVFEAKDDASAKSIAKERKDERTGLEALNQDTKSDPRMPKRGGPAFSAPESDLESLNRSAA